MDPLKLGLKLEVRPTVGPRSPRELLIFTVDDTLVDTSLYWLSRDVLARAVAERQGLAAPPPMADWESVDTRPYAAASAQDLQAAHDAMQLFQKLHGIPHGSESDLCLRISRSLRSPYPLVLAGAEDLISWARQRFTLALLASGDSQAQKAKLAAARLDAAFKRATILPAAKRKEDFQAMMQEMGFAPRNTWVIGSSVPADIQPGIDAGAYAIHYVNPYGSRLGGAGRGAETSAQFFSIHDLGDARAILAKPNTFVAA